MTEDITLDMDMDMDDFIEAHFGLCTNPECGAAFEFTPANILLPAGPVFCSRCKHPLFTGCIYCRAPFFYRPEKYCGYCSRNLAFDGRPLTSLTLLIKKRLSDQGEIIKPKPEDADHIFLPQEIETFFPCMMNNKIEDIREALESRGLDNLLPK
ncbi:MAG: hypothetical protein FWG92_00480 [Leptospirales bacterium]|nr:hypothetical protein [Leptospirales bacterium]